ncbi:Gfo/Idh/MocA family protein [Ornithinibacillus salinisoli]|uniref:Gfo/Idh/MocA family protein n=1 Tax=Ornithinibacillus salinisoli TaxID=1848459 RepID=A0ABW4W0X9_9BACI
MKFSTIGTSWITEMFIRAAKEQGELQLVSIYSRTEEAAERFATKNGALNWYTDLDDILHDESDFVYVASPNILHFEHVLTCIQHGKHVFSEKPMAYTEKQVQIIKEKANEHNVFVFEGYRHLYSPNYQILERNLDRVGKIRSVFMQYIQYSSKYDSFKEGNTPNVFSGKYAGGALMDLGVYPLSMTIDLFGTPAEVHYFPVRLSNGIDGSGTLVLTYQDFNVTIMCSKIAQGTVPSEFHGEDGTLTVDHISPINEITFFNRFTKDKEQLAVSQLGLDMVYEINAFIQMVENNDRTSFEKWMDRSKNVAKWTEKVRKDNQIVFPGE